MTTSELNEIKKLYSSGKNIVDYINQQKNDQQNSTEAIRISYDFQAGSYIKSAKKNAVYKENYTAALTSVIQSLGDFNSILEVGVGEATTLAHLIPKLNKQPNEIYGFDIAWSRIKYAQSYCKEKGLDHVHLLTGDLFNTPMQDNSIDLVYTSHSIEPNGGREKEALMELYRITNKFLVLLEPSYELAGQEARERMEKHGYVKNLFSTARDLGYNMIEHRLFEYSSNPLNPTGLMIIKKDAPSFNQASPLACPITKKPLQKVKGSYYCEESLLVYPVIDEIPCLLPQNAVIATHYLDDFNNS